MGDLQRKIYHKDTDHYEDLVPREDFQGNIIRSWGEIVKPDGSDVFDFGATTMRLTIVLAPYAESIQL